MGFFFFFLKHFSGLQFGCGEENGAEIIIHRTRRSHENGEKFVVLCISSHGVMSKETLAFVARMAAATGKTKKEIRSSILIALHQHNGAAIAQSRGRRWDR